MSEDKKKSEKMPFEVWMAAIEAQAFTKYLKKELDTLGISMN